MSKKILIADDEKNMRILISDFLINEGYEIIEASNGKEAVEKFKADSSIHLVILDVMMPLLDGWQTCELIRKMSQVPIIMLTAKNTEADELTGFIRGSDEYIKKPFSPTILVARVNALIKRTYQELDKTEEINKGNLNINLKQHVIKSNNETLDLSHTEYKLLMYLIENENNVLTRDMLLDSVWGTEYEGTDRTVDSHMNRLRVKMKSSGEYIKTVRGYGYKFEVVK